MDLGEHFLLPEMMGRQRLGLAELSLGESVTALFEVMVTGGTGEGIGGELAAGWTLRVGYTPVARGGGAVRMLVVKTVIRARNQRPGNAPVATDRCNFYAGRK